MKKIILLFFSLLRTLGVGVHSYLASMCMALALLSPMANAFAEEVTCSHTFAANDPHRTLCTTCKHTFFRYESKTNKEVPPNKPENLKGADGQSLGFTNTFADGHGVMEFEGPLVTIGLQAFYRGTGFTGELIIPNSVTSIGEGAFAGCSFNGNLVIPDSVTSIGDAAFNNCSGFTGSLVIPNSVTSIGEDAFSICCGFTGSLTIGNSVTSIGEYAFAYCSGFTGSLVIPDSVTSIGDYAFRGCSGFTGSLTIGNSVTSIGDYAFNDCKGFTGSLTIGNSVTSIGDYAFYGCEGFTGSLVIPDSVTSIGDGAFSCCFKVDGIVMTSVPQIGPGVFSSVYASKTVVLSENSYVYKEANEYFPEDASVTAPCTLDLTGSAVENHANLEIVHGENVYDPRKEPTCTAEGLTEGVHCEICSKVLVEQETIAALGHDYTSETDTEPYIKDTATCTADAVYFHKCSRCDEKGSTTWTKTGTALGHAWGEYHLDGDQTCTNDGHKTAECTREGCSEKNTIVATGEAFGHSFIEYFSNGDATTEADGTKTAECENGCGATETVIDEGSRIGLQIKDLQTGKDITLYLEAGVWVCHEELTFEDGVAFNSSVDFVADKVVYSRIASKDTMSVILPFDVPADRLNGVAYKLASFDGKDLHFETADGIQANTPCMVSGIKDKSQPLVASMENVTIKASNPIDVEDATGKSAHFGVYEKSLFECDEYDYYGFKNNQFVKAGIDIEVSPFRAAVRLTKSALRSLSYNPATLGIVFDGNEVTHAADIEQTMTGKVNVHDVTGRILRHNVEAANCTDGLEPGVYVVNGKKVVVTVKE